MINAKDYIDSLPPERREKIRARTDEILRQDQITRRGVFWFGFLCGSLAMMFVFTASSIAMFIRSLTGGQP